MKTHFKTSLALLFSGITMLCPAQENFLTQEKSIEIIRRGVKYHDDEKHDEALAEFKKVHRNDSNYYLAGVEMLTTYMVQKKYKEGLELCDELLKIKNDYTPNILIYKGDFLDNLGQHEAATKVYEKGLKDYPLNYSFYFEQAVSKLNQKKYDEAYELFIKTLKVNPFHAASHQQMAILAFRNNNFTSAILALQFYLVCDPSSDKAKRVVVDLEKLVKLELENDSVTPVKAFETGNDFTELESIIKSKVALSDRYKSKIDLEYSLTKQMQLIVENIGKYEDVKGFYNEFYGRFFSELQRAKLFEPLAYFTLKGMEIASVDKWIQKNKSDVERFEIWAYYYISEKMASFPENLNGKTTTVPHWYKNGKIAAAGFMDASRNNTGYWKFYYSNGILRSEGAFDQGGRNGPWRFYHPTGDIKEELVYNSGVEKVYKSFYQNNNLRVEMNAENNKIVGQRKTYFSNGRIASVTEYKNGEINGKETYYYRNGPLRYSIQNTQGVISGDLVEYFDNGRVYQKATFVEGKREGPGKYYHNNSENSVQKEGNYLHNNATGEWKTYYRSGKLYKVEVFNEDGELNGTVKEYYDNGKLQSEEAYSNNKLNGITKNYTDDGLLWQELLYKKGKLIEYRAYKKDGSLICNNKINGKNYEVTLYHPNGIKRREGRVSDGDLDGPWKDYSTFGVLTTLANYKEGRLDGDYFEYHNNGKVKRERHYTKGVETGYYKSYFKNGNKEYEGMVVDGDNEGYWYSYFADGTLSSRFYYLKGDIDGWYEYYSVTGKLSSEELNKEGCLVKVVYHDSTGAVSQNIDLPGGNGTIERKNEQGATVYKKIFVNDYPEGISETFYADGQVRIHSDYKQGKREGKQVNYNVFGKIVNEVPYFNNEKSGHELFYNDNGKVVSDFIFENGDYNGNCYSYHDNGKIFKDYKYEYDDVEGESNMYDETGQLIYKRYFHNDLLVSYTYKDATGNLLKPMELKAGDNKIECYYQNGKKSFEATYTNGDLNGHRIIYYSNGNVMSDDAFYFDQQHGPSKEFYYNGTVKSTENYYYGVLNGLKEEFHENGKIKFRGEYRKGVEHGVFSFYDTSGKLLKTMRFHNGNPVIIK